MVLERAPKKMKTMWWPQPHDLQGGVTFECDDGTLDATIVPLAFYDEGLGAPSAIETNPENAAFAVVTDQANCFVNSRINVMFAEFIFSLTSKFNDDNLTAIKIGTMPIFMSFINDYTAVDEVSSVEIQDVIEMQTESTDRQGGPLYVAAKDLPEKVAGIGVLGTNTPFLDTDTGIEAVDWRPDQFYDALHFLTIKEKLKKVTGGMKHEYLTANRPVIKKRFFIRPKVKRMNPFTYFGVLVSVQVQGQEQVGVITRDYTAATQYVDLDWKVRYNEWNEDFNMSKV